MPHGYIAKIVFDDRHCNLVMKKEGNIIAGACFRCFQDKVFAELVFLSVDHEFKNKGIGSKLIDQLKCKDLFR